MTENDDWHLTLTVSEKPSILGFFSEWQAAVTQNNREIEESQSMAPSGFELYLPKVDPTAELHKAWESAKWSEWEDAVIYEGTPIPYPVIGYDPAVSLFSETVPDYSIQTTWGGPYRNFQQAKIVPSPTLEEMMRNFRRKNADKTITRNPNCKL